MEMVQLRAFNTQLETFKELLKNKELLRRIHCKIEDGNGVNFSIQFDDDVSSNEKYVFSTHLRRNFERFFEEHKEKIFDWLLDSSEQHILDAADDLRNKANEQLNQLNQLTLPLKKGNTL